MPLGTAPRAGSPYRTFVIILVVIVSCISSFQRRWLSLAALIFAYYGFRSAHSSVCDLTSWLAGSGRGGGSPTDDIMASGSLDQSSWTQLNAHPGRCSAFLIRSASTRRPFKRSRASFVFSLALDSDMSPCVKQTAVADSQRVIPCLFDRSAGGVVCSMANASLT